jgi:hypothetical protein
MSEKNAVLFAVDMNPKIFKDIFPKELIHHEFIHARNYFLKQSKPCKNNTSTEHDLVPAVNQDNIKEYHKAFDMGDTRIKEFNRLWKINEQELSEIERNTLAEYKKASEGCLLKLWEDPSFSQTFYETLINSGWQDSKINSQLIQTFWGPQELIMIKKVHLKGNQHEYLGTIRPLHGAQTVLMSVAVTQSNIEYFYNTKVQENLIERETYTFAGLSLTAIKTFYPELINLERNL